MTTIAAERLEQEHAAGEIAAHRIDAAEAPASIDVDQLIRELDAAYNRLPEEALRACQANRELVTPRLIEVLQDTVRVGQEGAVRTGNAPIYAMFLLAEFEASESLPVIMELLKLPHDIPGSLLGESLTEDLPRLLVILAGSQIDLLGELIRDPTLNDYVRWAAADAFAYLVRDGRVTRQEAIERLQGHLAHATGRRETWITGPLIINLLALNANDARADIEEAFRQELVDEFFVSMKCVESELRPDQPDSCNTLDCRGPTKIADTVAEMRGWHWPGDDDSHDQRRISRDIWSVDPGNGQTARPLPLEDDLFSAPYESLTLHRQSARVGRNDPCPCGSGKKYKKCCLRQNASLA